MTAVATRVPAVRRAGSEKRRTSWLLLPAAAVVLVFFFYPLAVILWRSFTEPSFGAGNYLAVLGDEVQIRVLLRTLRTALIITVATLVIAYPYAYAMTLVGRRARSVLTLLVLMPFWTSLMARNFAWYVLEQRGGVIDRVLSAIGIDGVVLLGSVAGVTVAMVQVMLPFMVLPLQSSMLSIDRSLLHAAGSLGARRPVAFLRVYVPLSMPGVLAGVSVVFIMSLGFYITPALLGTPQQALVAQVIGTQVNDLLDFAGAGALGTILLVVTLVVLAVLSRVAAPLGTSAAGGAGRG
ncbi:ABC transporter permease [Amycolatopsis rubida]|uniref:ABC transporter permease n=2 Tax=Pseudonocardiaceae TaxID=2070 RepID=A0A1I6BEI4_9PSEU|nr:ABC transporter permease [Amycolatopsis rubida]MYW90008.1 ABC transporter permease subunit [Amycolatopsis rubida]NEC54985.1 ABC transporter permease [Amycolatopsis rubida]OAP29155.1 Spermidine/putrescine transport system permease protein PotB [Amycolatopsis sp. M39]SFQ79321.1 putative spermidine/putrescine transport system permease protein [Amycolatopsis rubida]